MTGKQENSGRCYFCQGPLKKGKTTIPRVLPDDTVVVVKRVPAEICIQCHEPYLYGETIDKITAMVDQIKPFRAEVLVVSYNEDLPDRSEASPNVVGIEPR